MEQLPTSGHSTPESNGPATRMRHVEFLRWQWAHTYETSGTLKAESGPESPGSVWIQVQGQDPVDSQGIRLFLEKRWTDTTPHRVYPAWNHRASQPGPQIMPPPTLLASAQRALYVHPIQPLR